jgi:hypothetical protein
MVSAATAAETAWLTGAAELASPFDAGCGSAILSQVDQSFASLTR